MAPFPVWGFWLIKVKGLAGPSVKSKVPSATWRSVQVYIVDESFHTQDILTLVTSP